MSRMVSRAVGLARQPQRVLGHQLNADGGLTMGIGISIFLLAVGAILTFAVNVTTSGVNLDTVSVVLMVVGAIGLLMSLLFWSSFAPWGHPHTDTYIRDDRF